MCQKKMKGFSLVELKAATILGMIVVVLAGIILQYEWSRHMSVRRWDRLTQSINQLDSQLFYLVWDCQYLEVQKKQCHFITSDRVWILKQDEFSCNGNSCLSYNIVLEIDSIQPYAEILQINGRMTYDDISEQFEFSYPLMGKHNQGKQ